MWRPRATWAPACSPDGTAPGPRTFLLGGQAGLTRAPHAARRAAWIVALAVTGLVFGLVAQAAGKALRGAAGIEQAIERLGGTAAGRRRTSGSCS